MGEWKKSRGVWLGLWEQAVQAGSPGLTVGGGEALLERKQRQRAGLGGEGLGGAGPEQAGASGLPGLEPRWPWDSTVGAKQLEGS